MWFLYLFDRCFMQHSRLFHVPYMMAASVRGGTHDHPKGCWVFQFIIGFHHLNQCKWKCMVECHILNLWCWNVFRTQVCKRERDLLESSELCSTVLFIWQVLKSSSTAFIHWKTHLDKYKCTKSNDPWGNSCILPVFVVNLFLPNSKKITKTKKNKTKNISTITVTTQVRKRCGI